MSYHEDYKIGKDPDCSNKCLYEQHQLLWTKHLPCGRIFNLELDGKSCYELSHKSDLGNFRLKSDGIAHTYSHDVGRQVSSDILGDIVIQNNIDSFFELSCTIGGYIVFPLNMDKTDKRQTINQARGTNPLIMDRFDLTLECIRRWYDRDNPLPNPLSDCLTRYKDFFDLFKKDPEDKEGFKRYVDFFLLNDLVNEDGTIRFWLTNTIPDVASESFPFNDVGVTNPLPETVDEYKEYMVNVLDFITARNRRIYEEYNKTENETEK